MYMLLIQLRGVLFIRFFAHKAGRTPLIPLASVLFNYWLQSFGAIDAAKLHIFFDSKPIIFLVFFFGGGNCTDY